MTSLNISGTEMEFYGTVTQQKWGIPNTIFMLFLILLVLISFISYFIINHFERYWTQDDVITEYSQTNKSDL